MAAAVFSARWVSELVPGIGMITGERCSSQARATWVGVASSSAATSASGPVRAALVCPAFSGRWILLFQAALWVLM